MMPTGIPLPGPVIGMAYRRSGYGDTFYVDEFFVKINGQQHYFWRAVGQDGEVVDVYLQAKRDGSAAKHFLKRLLRSHGGEPRKIFTDKLRSYGVAHRALIPNVIHDDSQYASIFLSQHRGWYWTDRSHRDFYSQGAIKVYPYRN
jgi:putative transposase